MNDPLANQAANHEANLVADQATGHEPIAATRSRNRVRSWAIIGVIAAVLGFVLAKGLGTATLYFREVDQALAERSELGTRRFRIEGIVLDGTIKKATTGGKTVVTFTIQQNGADVNVEHRGDPPELFQPNIPVVLEGAFASTTGEPLYRSDRILVRHSNEYRQKNSDRVKNYEEPSTA
jgi:cytochrome c-type biogenesis protein CcmE